MGSNLGRFRWGVDIDDVWKYAGLPGPNSVVVPYLMSVPVGRERFSLPTSNESQSPSTSPLPVGGVNGGRDKRSPQDLASFLRRSGVDFVRCWFQWNFFQPRILKSLEAADDGSVYQFPLDDFVSKMTREGIQVVGAIGSGYDRFLPPGLGTDRIGEYLAKLRESSAQIVRHYKDSVKVWQIENEPNWWWAHYTSAWRRGLVWLQRRNQGPILGTLHDVVRSECPGASIIVNLQVHERTADWGFYSKYCDILGLDSYPNYLRRTPDSGRILATTASRVRKETGRPVMVVETGYPSSPRVFGFDERKQSQYVRAACQAAYGCDAIAGLGWFRFSDSYWRSFPPQENHFGLLTREGRPKAGWGEFVTQISQKR